MRARAAWIEVRLTDCKKYLLDCRKAANGRKTAGNGREMKKPPAAFAGDGLGVTSLLNPVDQALFPARTLWTLIRWAGIGASVHGTGKKLASMAEVCMSLKKSRPEGRGARQDARHARTFLRTADSDRSRLAEGVCRGVGRPRPCNVQGLIVDKLGVTF